MSAATLVRELTGAATATSQSRVAFDRASVRTFDSDGHLHVSETNISKATVNPYYGREIPGNRELGLDANKTYRMLRDPAELAKSAATFDGKPLLFHHLPLHSNDHAFDFVVGSIGDARFEPPYLKAKLHVWPKMAIDAINSAEKKELSCGYKYTADMTPGVYDGMPYDGIMRDIVGNHVALVKEGRAGPDVVVGDSKLETFKMPQALSRKAAVAQGALIAYLYPKLAADEQIDLVPALTNVTATNYVEKKPEIIAAVQEAVKGKLVQDASVDDVVQLLDKLDTVLPADPSKSDPNATTKDADPKGEDPEDPNETPEERKKRLAALAAKNLGGTSDKGKKAMDGMVTAEEMGKSIQVAVDEALKTAATNSIKLANDIREAERFVRPYVGELAMSFDSAESVYKQALIVKGKDAKEIEGIHPSAYKHILAAMPTADAAARQTSQRPAQAADSAANDDFFARYPGAKNIQVAG
jgi:hypothetical protein